MASESLKNSELEDDNFFSNMFLARDEHGAVNNDSLDDSDSNFDIDRPVFNDIEDIAIEEEDNTGPTIQIRTTQTLREVIAQAGEDVAEPIRQTLIFMDARGINLAIFLDGISWGSEACIQDAKIQSARSSLMASEELPNIVRRRWKPPRAKGSKNKRPKGAGPVMESFTKECCQSILDWELEGIVRLLVSPV